MNELLKVNYDNDRITLSARELHKFLGVTERFGNWFEPIWISRKCWLFRA